MTLTNYRKRRSIILIVRKKGCITSNTGCNERMKELFKSQVLLIAMISVCNLSKSQKIINSTHKIEALALNIMTDLKFKLEIISLTLNDAKFLVSNHNF
jgi:hypothetical protein